MSEESRYWPAGDLVDALLAIGAAAERLCRSAADAEPLAPSAYPPGGQVVIGRTGPQVVCVPRADLDALRDRIAEFAVLQMMEEVSHG
jgi:hypothetical protein